MIDVYDDPERQAAEAQLAARWSRPPGFLGWIAEVNNQPLGKRYMITSLLFFCVAGVLSLFLRAQLTVAEAELIGPDTFNAIFTMHGSTMMYLFAVPFVEGLALYLIPLMIGSRDVAFPRLTSFGYWMYLFGGLIMYASFFGGHVPDAGWFAYTPLSGPEFSDLGLDFWLLGLGLVEIAGLSAGLEIVVTILKMRAPGMALHRMPLMVWSFLVAGVMILFGFTPLLVATLLLEMDRSLGTAFFDVAGGGSSLLWQHLFWYFGHPEVYIVFLPAVGAVSTIIPAFARRPIVGYTLVVAGLVIIGFVSFGLWAHHMFTTGLPEVSLLFFAAASFMVALGSSVQIYAWIATLWRSRPRYDSPLLYVLGFFFTFVIGGLTGVMVATLPFDWQVHDTYFVVAHLHYVLIGGVVFPVLAGLHYWLPKLSGHRVIEGWARWGFWLIFIGFNLTFFPMHIMGFFGMPRRNYTYSVELGLDGYNIAATIGAAVMAIGFIVALGNLLVSARRGPLAGADPWQAHTLEWTIQSPPRSYAFARPPVVRSREPGWDAELEQADHPHTRLSRALELRPLGWRGSLISSVVEAEPQALQALPGPTLLPFVTAIALTLTAVGVLAKSLALAVVAGAFSVGMIAHWLWEDVRMEEPEATQLREASGLPVATHGRRSVAWWGTIGLLAILATALGALVFSYFYLRLYSTQWPGGSISQPSFWWHTGAIASLLFSGLVQAWMSWRRRATGVAPRPAAYIVLLVTGAAAAVLLILALATSGVGLTSNAYGSATITLGSYAVALILTGVALHIGGIARRVVGMPGGAAPPLALEVAELFWLFVVVAGLIIYATLGLSAEIY
ncbi:MAG: cbb3-type cytochrome c oxidase subunit I [Enhygromyxa sp.]